MAVENAEDRGLLIGPAASYLGVSPTTLRRYDRSGVLSALRDPANGYRVYRRRDLDAFRCRVVGEDGPLARLRRLYGSPRLGNPLDPLDVLYYTLLSLRTTDRVLQRVWPAFTGRFAPWSSLLESDAADVAAVLRPAGFSVTRARAFRELAAALRDRFGQVTLEPLAHLGDTEAMAQLLTLPCVGVKTARCVLLFGLHRDVCPVDSHVHRVASRLGLLEHPLDYSPSLHAAIDAVVPAGLAYHFHTNFVAHGRTVCRPRRPRCERCPLGGACPSSSVGGHR